MLKGLRNTSRLLAIALILAREDALFIFTDLSFLPWLPTILKPLARFRHGRRKGERLAAALQRLGPTFIKLGQVLSTRSDLVGEEIANDLSGLRDALPAFSSTVARAIIETELQHSINELFLEFNNVPIAAASIAQVHRAVLNNGKKVAVKILRPHIEKAFERDLDLFSWIACIVETRMVSYRRLKPVEVVKTLRESVFLELDLRFEAAAAVELSENLKRHRAGMRVPAVEWNLTSKRVLVLEWVDGIAINDVEAIRSCGLDVNAILTKAAQSLFVQVFKDGFFHADLHPGNLFVDNQGELVAVDFGIMGRLDRKSRIYIAEILRGFLSGDYRHVAEVHFTAGYVPAHKSLEIFTQACMAVAGPIMGKPLNEISIARLLGQMFAIAAEFEMETQPQLLLMQKTMMVSEGVGRMLNPNLNMWELARPMIEEWVSEQFGPSAKLKEAAQQGMDGLKKLPAMLQSLERSIEMISDPQGIKIHPVTIDAINAGDRTWQPQWLVFGWTTLAVFTLLAVSYLAH